MIPLRAIADSIAARGIRHITGRVVAARRRVSRRGARLRLVVRRFRGLVLGADRRAAVQRRVQRDPRSRRRAPGRSGARRGHGRRDRSRACDMRRDRRRASRTPTRARRRPNTLRARKDSTTWEIIARGPDRRRATTATIEVTHHDPDAAYLAAVREALARPGHHDRRGRGGHDARASTRSRRSRRRR